MSNQHLPPEQPQQPASPEACNSLKASDSLKASNSLKASDSLTESRITELETRVAYQEDLLNALNDVIANQDRLLANLTSKLERLEEQQRQGGYGDGGGGDGLAHEPPPHY